MALTPKQRIEKKRLEGQVKPVTTSPAQTKALTEQTITTAGGTAVKAAESPKFRIELERIRQEQISGKTQTGLAGGRAGEAARRIETRELKQQETTAAAAAVAATPTEVVPTPAEVTPTPTPTVGAGLTPAQQEFIDAVKKQEETRAKEEEKQKAKAGRGIAGTTTFEDVPKLPEVPEVFQSQQLLNQSVALQQQDLANSTFSAQERGRRQSMIRSLTSTNIQQAVEASGGTLAGLTTQQLEEFAASQNIELSDKVRSRLQSEGKSLIENLNISKNQRLAENQFMQQQLSRQFDRATTDRENFNALQDAKFRRLAAAFGGGKASSLSANVAVMREQEKGVRILEDLRIQHTDRQGLVSSNTKGIIDTYTNNINLIESKTAEILENKLAEITTTIDDLIDAGVTNQEQLNNAVSKLKNDYWKAYNKTNETALRFMTEENQRLFNNQVKLTQLQQTEDNTLTRNTGIMYKNGEPVVDAEGNQVPTFENIKFAKTEDRFLSQQTGFIYQNGKKLLDQAGQPIQTISGQQLGIARARLGLEAARLTLASQKIANKVAGRRQLTGGVPLDNEGILKVERFVRRGGTQEERDNLRNLITPLVAQGLDDTEIAKQVFGTELTESQQKIRNTLADDIRAEPAYKSMLSISTGMQGVIVGLEAGDGFGDITAINAFQRMIDPGVSVKEGDVAILQKASAFFDKADFNFIINSWTQGDLLPPETRDKMQNVADNLYTRQSNLFNKTVGNRFERNAESANIPFELIGEKFPPVSELKELGIEELAIPEEAEPAGPGLGLGGPTGQTIEFTGTTREEAIQALGEGNIPITPANIKILLPNSQ